MRYIALIFVVLVLAVTGCGSPSPAAINRAICHIANTTQSPSLDTDTQMDSARDGGAPTPGLARLLTADVSAYNSPGDLGGAFAAAGHALGAFGDIQTWCQSNGYGQS
jgi:hypothetical protein